MAASLQLNVSTSELDESGFAKTLNCDRFQFDGQLPEGLWVEPFTHNLMMKPGPMARDFQYWAEFSTDHIATPSGFTLASSAWEAVDRRSYTTYETTSYGKTLVCKANVNPTLGLAIDMIESAVLASQAKLTYPEWAMISAAALEVNQGFAIAGWKARMFQFRDSVSAVLKFGLNWGLVLGHGWYELHKWTQSTNTWEFRERFTLPVDDTPEVSEYLVVLPLQPNKIGFYKSVAGIRASESRSLHTNRSASVGELRPLHVYDVPETELQSNTGLGAGFKEIFKADKLYVGVLPYFSYRISICKVRFPQDSCTVRLKGEDMQQLHSQTPTPYLWGWAPANSTHDYEVLNSEDHSAWDSATDTKPQLEITLARSTTMPWASPQISQADMQFLPVVTTHTRTPVDISAKFSECRFRLHLEDHAQEMTVGLPDPAGTYSAYRTKASVPSTLDVDSTRIFKGFSKGTRVPRGLDNAIAHIQLDFGDGWERLEEQVVGEKLLAFDNVSHVTAMKRILNEAGFPDAEIQADTDTEVLPPEGQKSNDPCFQFCGGASLADAARRILTWAGWTLRHDGTYWQYRQKVKKGASTLAMYVNSLDFAASAVAAASRTTVTEWTYQVDPPEFTRFILLGPDSSGPGAQKIQAMWPINQAAEDALLASEGMEHVITAVETCPWANHQGVVNRLCEMVGREFGYTRHTISCKGPWKKAFLPGKIVTFYEHTGTAYQGGFGAVDTANPLTDASYNWRIDEVDVEIIGHGRTNEPDIYIAQYQLTRIPSA